ncbi:SDR family NAD(P)-dependent oxidoreductase [Epilithonimonas hungarica]|uniref:3alpha(Or 20beta)-hydroxysteroid dehydrogenase n=1 Tax=Epilithonimonas hungarica TaxID=454006 RepID=A0A1G7SDW5_9FLAO|nr:glucose 1-dehydrogenase [Epilithonimonas hungarica]SDG20400.1 3alpha(or 20beta)-hydroxysteroid dehydrogenase [Epilithonimonas hungarica]
MSRLKDKVAIVTGGAQGIGEATVRAFIAEGASVVLTDLNEKKGVELVKELGQNAFFIKHDVSNTEDWERVISQTEAQFGYVNVLVNNAGIFGPVAKVVDLDKKDYLNAININQNSVFYGMKYTVPSMLNAGKGSIVNLSSMAGIAAVNGFPSVAYVSAKFAVRGMSKAVAVEYADNNIRVNSVHPGFIKTPMSAAAFTEDDVMKELASKYVPLKRWSEASEVASLNVFLASDESAYITGTELIIDGGVTAS